LGGFLKFLKKSYEGGTDFETPLRRGIEIISEKENYRKADIDELTTTLKFLTKILYEKYNKKVVVLVDEYDSPLVSAYINGYYESAKDFFKTFYSTVLKDNA